MANSIREYLEKGRAGKQFDINRNLWIDPVTGKAFIPSFTNIQGNENMPVRPYRAGTFPSGEQYQQPGVGPTQDVVQYAGTPGEATPVEQRPAMTVAPEEGVRMGPQGMPQKQQGMPMNEAPDPNNPAAMAAAVIKTMVQRGEFKQLMGLPPDYKFELGPDGKPTELEKAYTNTVMNQYKVMTDHFARRIENQTRYRKDQMQASGMKTKDIMEMIDRLVRPEIDPLTGKPKQQPMSEDEAEAYVFDRMARLNQRLGLVEQRVGGPTAQTGGQGQTVTKTVTPGKSQGKVIGKIRDKKTGAEVNVYEDGTAIIGGQRRKIPQQLLDTLLPKGKTKGKQEPAKQPQSFNYQQRMPKGPQVPTSRIPGRDAQAQLSAMLEAGQPNVGFDYSKYVPQGYADMYSQYLKK